MPYYTGSNPSNQNLNGTKAGQPATNPAYTNLNGTPGGARFGLGGAQPMQGGASPWGATYRGTGDVANALGTVRTARTSAMGAQSPYGTESGPGILESWFNQRATGTDPAYEYAMRRGGDAIDARMAAGGSYNSGARGQQLSDFAANMAAQRMGQLDTLAGGASGEHMGRLNQMFNQGLGLANGQAGAGTAYDTAAAGNMQAANAAQMAMNLNKAGVDAKANQGLINTGLNIWALSNAMGGGGGGGGNPYYNANNPYPV